MTTELSFGRAQKRTLSVQCLEPYIPAISFTPPTLDPITAEPSASFRPLTPYTNIRCSCARCTRRPTFMALLTTAASYLLPPDARASLLHVCAFSLFILAPDKFFRSWLKQDSCTAKRPKAQHEDIWCFKGCTPSSTLVPEKLPALPRFRPRWWALS